MKSKVEKIVTYLDELYGNAKCELDYNLDYELLIATVLSAQCTDKRVNMVTKDLWQKYDLKGLSMASLEDIMAVIRPVGNFRKKAFYLKSIAQRLILDCDGKVPNDFSYLSSLPGVGRKTINVVLANLYDVPSIAVDTHVFRVSKRLGLAYFSDSVLEVEEKLMKKISKDRWILFHHQMVLFGRYKCRAVKPLCADCHLKDICKYYKGK